MQRNEDWKDLTIRWQEHPKYKKDKVTEDSLIEVITQKLEMILYTNTDEILGDDGYAVGINLEYYLWETKISKEILQGKIAQQINIFIPEMNVIGYDLNLKIFEGKFRDILEIYINIKGYNLEFIFV